MPQQNNPFELGEPIQEGTIQQINNPFELGPPISGPTKPDGIDWEAHVAEAKEIAGNLWEDVKEYYHWLHLPTEPPESFADFATRILPTSISKTAVGIAEFPYYLIKSFQDAAIQGLFDESVQRRADDLELEDVTAELGIPSQAISGLEGELVKNTANQIDGIARFMGEPIGLYGWERMKERWSTDPASSLAAIAPYIKGVRGLIKEAPPRMAAPPNTEFMPITPKDIERAEKIIQRQEVAETPSGALIGDALVREMKRKKRGVVKEPVKPVPVRKGEAPEVPPAEYAKEIPTEISVKPGVEKPSTLKEFKKQTEFHGGPPVDTLLEDLKNSRWASKLIDIIDVEAKFRREGAPETGHKAKVYFDTKFMHQEIGLDKVREFARLADYNKKTFSDAVFAAESATKLRRTDPKVKPAGEYLRRFHDEAQAKYAERGVKADFQDLLRQQVLDLMNKAEESEIPELQRVLEAVEDFRFVHIPTAQWFMSTLDSPVKRNKALKLLATQERKTFNIESLVKKGVIKPSEVNGADIIASYSRRMGADFALLDLVDAAVKEGLASRTRKKGYVKMSPRIAPILKDYWLKPRFHDHIFDMLQFRERMGLWKKAVTATKMFAFYNPLFLPMYDVIQQVMATNIGFVKAAISTAKSLRFPFSFEEGFRSAARKDSAYYEAASHGLRSKPFDIGYDSYWDWVAKNQQTAKGRILEGITGQITRLWEAKGFGRVPILPEIYHASWNVAWELDAAVRMGTYRYLKDNRGYSARDAAQMAAKFHSDYASVPPKTRRALNNVFFTPTFKITMGKLLAQMMQDSYRIMSKTLTGDIKGITPKQARYAAGMLGALAVIQGADMFFKGLGFEEDEWGRRYKKAVTMEDGSEKEVMVTWSNPANMFMKYAHRFLKAIDSPNPIRSFLLSNRWELHPIWRVTYDLATGKDPEGKIIYDWQIDGSWNSSVRMAHYATTELLAILGTFDPDQTTVEGREAFKKDVGKTIELVTRPFTFRYTTDPTQIRKAKQIRSFLYRFRAYIDNKIEHKQTWTEDNINNFRKEIEKLQKELLETPEK